MPLFHLLLEDLLAIRLFRALVEGILELSVRDNPGRIQEHDWRRLNFLIVSLVLHQALSERVHRVESGGCSEKKFIPSLAPEVFRFTLDGPCEIFSRHIF